MTTERKLLFTSIMAGVFALAAIGSGGLLLKALKVFRVATPGSKIESPILASGGSMTFRSHSTWACSNPQTCTTTVSTTTLTAERLYQPVGNNNWNGAPSPLVSMNPVTLYMRPDNGDPGMNAPASPGASTTPYITITNTGTTIQVQVTNVSGTQAVLVDSSATEPARNGLTPVYSKQYFDPGCRLHGTLFVPIPSTIIACEHPGWVLFADQQNYLCLHGLCAITLY